MPHDAKNRHIAVGAFVKCSGDSVVCIGVVERADDNYVLVRVCADAVRDGDKRTVRTACRYVYFTPDNVEVIDG